MQNQHRIFHAPASVALRLSKRAVMQSHFWQRRARLEFEVVRDVIALGLPETSQTLDIIWQARCSASDTVEIWGWNPGSGAVDPPSATFNMTIFHY